jgi:hypothetical protein
MDEDTSRKIIKRLERLEKAVFGKEGKSHHKSDPSIFKGATGGARLLLSKDFFNKKKTLAEVRSALAKNDYHYSAQAVQMALSRLSSRTGPLATLKEGGLKVYVKRK